MKIKNMSAKPIYIGELGVLPNDTKEIPDSYKNHPVVKMYIRRGLVAEVSETKASAEIPDEIGDDSETPVKPDDTPKTPAKSGTKSKASSKVAATKKETENQNSEPPAAENQDEVQENGDSSEGENPEQNTETE